MSFPANNPRSCPSVLFINGFPGVGKLSVAREVQKQLTASRLLDNHLLIDVAQAIEPNRGPAHYALRTVLRRAAFDGLKAVEDESVTLILTSCSASTLPHDVEVFSEFVDIARARGVPFVSVNLVCDERENVERATNEERGKDKGKLMDGQAIVDMRTKHRLLDASVCEEETAGVEVYHLEVDSTNISVQQSADKVMDFLLKNCC
ncbi:hypothetical protein B0H14DRAFT_306393 [Mycena olivaceomarginata]|nr:hypothetical protein B0H14DRAFT_306393 [Mycena olivaceomarginata]